MGLKKVPELILSPIEFDLPREFPVNQIHVGPVVDLNRIETDIDLNFQENWDIILTKLTRKEVKLVYCALGSCTFDYIKSRISFYIKIINIFLKKKDTILILSTGNKINPSLFGCKSDNIFVFKNVPQLKILKYSNLNKSWWNAIRN